MSGKRMEPAAPALQKHHHRRRRHTRIWPLAVGAAALAALVIGVWSLIAGYFILNPPVSYTHLTLPTNSRV